MWLGTPSSTTLASSNLVWFESILSIVTQSSLTSVETLSLSSISTKFDFISDETPSSNLMKCGGAIWVESEHVCLSA